jgi:hypothetical protein
MLIVLARFEETHQFSLSKFPLLSLPARLWLGFLISSPYCRNKKHWASNAEVVAICPQK